MAFGCVWASANAEDRNGSEPHPLVAAFHNTDLEMLARTQAILVGVCKDSSLDDRIGKELALLRMKHLGSAVKDQEDWDTAFAVQVVYEIGYAAGANLGLVTESPERKRHVCESMRKHAIKQLDSLTPRF